MKKFKARDNSNVAVSDYKKYIGWAFTKVLAVNPTKEERNKILNIDSDKIPEYVGTTEKGDKFAKVVFYIQPLDLDKNPIEGAIMQATFFITKSYNFNKDNTKVQVIDNYGYSGWATEEQIKNHEKLISANGKPLRISETYRPAYNGEIALIEFIKNYLNIDEYFAYVEGIWTKNTKTLPEDCECLTETLKFFSGDFSEIKDIPSLMPSNILKMVYGVNFNNGNVYQDVYTNKTCKATTKSIKEIEKDILSRKERGGLQNREYDFEYLHEYVKVTPTENFNSTSSNMPFQTPNENTIVDNPWLNN